MERSYLSLMYLQTTFCLTQFCYSANINTHKLFPNTLPRLRLINKQTLWIKGKKILFVSKWFEAYSRTSKPPEVTQSRLKSPKVAQSRLKSKHSNCI